MKYWHVFTRGLEKENIFRCREDFIYGMNGIPIHAYICDIKVFAFCLMTNHVHFVIAGKEDNCVEFIRTYRRRLSKLADMGDSTAIGIKEIPDQEYFQKAVTYVLRNSLSSEPKILPVFYEWSSGSCYFRGHREMTHESHSKISDYNYREIRKILHTNTPLPGHYQLTLEGMICPDSYVQTEKVEEIFRTPVRFLYHLSHNLKMEISLNEGVLSSISYTDKELLASVKKICRDMFGKPDIFTLSIEQKCLLADIIRKKFGIGIKQMSRLSGLSSALLKKVYE